MTNTFKIGFDRAYRETVQPDVAERRESRLWILWMLAPVVMLFVFGSGVVGGCTGTKGGECVFDRGAVNDLQIGQSKSHVQQQVCRDGLFGGFKTRRAVLTSSGEDYVDAAFCVEGRAASASESWKFVRPVSSVELHFSSGQLTAIEQETPFDWF